MCKRRCGPSRYIPSQGPSPICPKTTTTSDNETKPPALCLRVIFNHKQFDWRRQIDRFSVQPWVSSIVWKPRKTKPIKLCDFVKATNEQQSKFSGQNSSHRVCRTPRSTKTTTVFVGLHPRAVQSDVKEKIVCATVGCGTDHANFRFGTAEPRKIT